MLESLKRFFGGQVPGRPFDDVNDWARQRGLVFKRSRDGGGFAIDGALNGKPWRLEWGPPQRAYIQGQELRLRMELSLPSDMQMLLLSRPLMETLERQTYEQFVEGNTTQIDTSTPEEMRWLVMFPKVNMNASKLVRTHYGAVASAPASGMAWLDGTLVHLLERAVGSMLRNDPPFLLMTLRGRAYLRMQLADPDAATLTMALALFEAGVTQALALAAGQSDSTSHWPSTGTTAWQSLAPVDPLEPDGSVKKKR